MDLTLGKGIAKKANEVSSDIIALIEKEEYWVARLSLQLALTFIETHTCRMCGKYPEVDEYLFEHDKCYDCVVKESGW